MRISTSVSSGAFRLLVGSKTVRYGLPCRTRVARRVFHDPGRLLIPNLGSEDLKFLLAAEKQLKESRSLARLAAAMNTASQATVDGAHRVSQ